MIDRLHRKSSAVLLLLLLLLYSGITRTAAHLRRRYPSNYCRVRRYALDSPKQSTPPTGTRVNMMRRVKILRRLSSSSSSSGVYTLGDRIPTIHDSAWIAPTAAVIGDVVLEENTSVWFNVVIRGDNGTIIVKEGSNIQDGSVLHTDPGLELEVGKRVTVGHNCMLHGCVIGDNSLIGIGSVVLNNSKIGKNCIIGANSLIPQGKQIPDNSLVMGSPGKVVKTLSEAQIEMLKFSAEGYVMNAKRFSEELKEGAIDNGDGPRSSL